MLRLLLLVLWTAAIPLAQAQDAEAPPKPCSSPEFRQFDFWLGEWELTWEGGSGTNHITAPLGDCVIQEQFEGDMGGGNMFRGMSVSTYDPNQGLWRQTWVDNSGGYLVFTGGLDGDDMILRGGTEANLTRMIFADIQTESLTWRWERSTDGGKTWEPRWLIHYTRPVKP